MTMCRRFKGQPVERLTLTMPAAMVSAVDMLMMRQPEHPARGCRSEFVRLAVAEKLGRELMLSAMPAPSGRTST
jgi:hypothetical protein